MGASANGADGDLDFQDTFLTVTDQDLLPRDRGESLRPLLYGQERDLRRRSALSRTALGRWCRQVAYLGVGRHVQDIPLALLAKLSAKVGGPTELIVADNPLVREFGAGESEQILGDLDLGSESDRARDVTRIQTSAAPGPLVRKIEIPVDERVAAVSDVSQEDAHLAIVLLPQSAAPLSGDADGVGSLLGEPAGVQDQDPLGISEDLRDLSMKLSSDGRVLPLSLADEPLQTCARMMVSDGNGLDRLSVKVTHEPFQIHLGKLALLLPIEVRREGLGELTQLAERFSDLRDLDLGGLEKLLRNVRNRQRHNPPSLGSPEGLWTSFSKLSAENAGQ
jgi:hypothetical protein